MSEKISTAAVSSCLSRIDEMGGPHQENTSCSGNGVCGDAAISLRMAPLVASTDDAILDIQQYILDGGVCPSTVGCDDVHTSSVAGFRWSEWSACRELAILCGWQGRKSCGDKSAEPTAATHHVRLALGMCMCLHPACPYEVYVSLLSVCNRLTVLLASQAKAAGGPECAEAAACHRREAAGRGCCTGHRSAKDTAL